MKPSPSLQIGHPVDEAFLLSKGYVKTHVSATWQDVGTAENGPKLVGGPAYDQWDKGNHSYYVVDGMLEGEETWPTEL